MSKKLPPENKSDLLPLMVRAFVPPKSKDQNSRKLFMGPSEWALIFDTETTTTPEQALRFGVYQLRKSDSLDEAGIFFNPETLNAEEQKTLKCYALEKNLKFMTHDEFIENIFFLIGYEFRATIIGFNLPFDLSRLAFRHNPSRGKSMRGGFTFHFSTKPWWPKIQIKHLSSRNALISFAKVWKRQDTRGMRKRKIEVQQNSGYFVDVKTIAAAQTSQSFTLGKLAEFLQTEHHKHSTDEYSGPLTDSFIAYAVEDVQVTWECYRILKEKYEQHELNETLLSKVYSEASLGKASLKEMGIKPWREMQPDFPDHLTGIIMSTYYGGRSEIHIRRTPTQVLCCDFLSMYPTVCTLMGLWCFVRAKEIKWYENTSEIGTFLKSVTLSDLQGMDIWKSFTTLVQVLPEDDIFPIRAKYTEEAQATIGLNHLSSETPLWFTLADCIAAKLLTGKCVKIVRAITFKPGEMQDNLKPLTIAGSENYKIDPNTGDFYCSLIDCRNKIKAKLKHATGAQKDRLVSEQQALKIMANATSYGIFVELNVEHINKSEQKHCYGPSGEAFQITPDKIEEPGHYFHPLLATLITGAARLMLAISETLVKEANLDWAFCDTDSMALAKPERLESEVFFSLAQGICDWFKPLNPYEKKDPLFKVEDANYAIVNGKLTKTFTPLYCLAVSSKRYALFNLGNDGKPIIRKASAHGLGHLRAPYSEEAAPNSIPAPCVSLVEIDVERWQYDLWYQIITAVLEGHPNQVDLSYHPDLDQPAASRYAATTPDLLGWFKTYNQDKPYGNQVRPFNFMLAFQLSLMSAIELENAQQKHSKIDPTALKPIAPYNKNISLAAQNCFDRATGESISPKLLKTYREALAQYHLSPESKFLNGERLDIGITRRRHVQAVSINHIGKEANNWEKQSYLGYEESERIKYGTAPEGLDQFVKLLNKAAEKIGQRKLTAMLNTSRSTLVKMLKGEVKKKITPRIGEFLHIITEVTRTPEIL